MTLAPNHAPCVMIVEDEFAIREALTEFLEEEGFEVSGAAHGKEALRLLTSSDSLPAVILLDLMMPVMNGQQFLEAQQRDPVLASIPVILLSAASDAHERLPEERVAGYLDKPVRLLDILDVVGRYCQPETSTETSA